MDRNITTIEEWLGEDNTLGIDIWKKKYQYNNESFNSWINRISAGNDNIKKLILDKKFLFGGRILSARGLDYSKNKVSLSNCYVIKTPKDSIPSIFNTAKKAAVTYSRGGGCGIDCSNLAPRGAKVQNSAKNTSGAVSFMDLYNLTTNLIGQGGRRGALMLSLRCDHPDIEEFINIKRDLKKITEANISVKMTDKFMRAVEYGEDVKLHFYRPETGETITKTVNSLDIFNTICQNNYDMGEPGMIFWDTVTNWNMLSDYDNFEFAGLNPCAEEPLPSGGSCLLGSINLAEFVMDGLFKFSDFEYTVKEATRALNEVLDEGLPLHPLKEQRKSVKNWRQIGLGIFGLSDMLIKLNIKYGSKESLNLCNQIGYSLINTSFYQSCMLAEENGKPFKKFDLESLEKSRFYQNNISENNKKLVAKYGMMNSQLLSIAPTGTISNLLGVSGGIEPIYSFSIRRKTISLNKEEKYYDYIIPIAKKYMEENNLSNINDLPDYFVSAKDIDYKDRLSMQMIFQNYVDASISSTINLPETATSKDIGEIYLTAWNKGLKGVTVFREGCDREAILTDTSNEDNKSNNITNDKDINENDIYYNSISPITREQISNEPLDGRTYIKKTACGKMYIHVNHEPKGNNIVEVFVDPSKSGGCAANADCLGRSASTALRSGVTVESVVDTTSGVKCSACMNAKGRKVEIDGLSCGDAIARAIKEEYEYLNEIRKETIIKPNNKTVVNNSPKIKTVKNSLCPNCGEPLVHEGGCIVCKNCEYSKCD